MATDDGPGLNSRHRSEAPVSGWLVVVLLIMIVALVFHLLGRSLMSLLPRQRPAISVVRSGSLNVYEQATVELFRHSTSSCVYITTKALRRDSPFLREGLPGTGSGIVWDKDGHIVTNYHVIGEVVKTRGTATVTLMNDAIWPGRLVGYDVENDLAVLKIDAPAADLQPIPVGTSNDLEIGQDVYAIGNPFGLDHTLTRGIISGLGRIVPSPLGHSMVIAGAIQTDAAINPGNSGGPLLDSHGRLIGLNTAIVSPSGAYAGVGFAIPADTVVRIVPDLIEYGRVDRPGLGIYAFDENRFSHIRRQQKLEPRGVLIEYVLPGSSAADAGLRPTGISRAGRIVIGDLILAVDGNRVLINADLHRALAGRRVGDELTLTIWRDGKERDVVLNLKAKPAFSP